MSLEICESLSCVTVVVFSLDRSEGNVVICGLDPNSDSSLTANCKFHS